MQNVITVILSLLMKAAEVILAILKGLFSLIKEYAPVAWEKWKLFLRKQHAPIILFVILLVMSLLFAPIGANGLATVLYVLLLLSMGVSIFFNYSIYTVKMQRICIVLCVVAGIILVMNDYAPSNDGYDSPSSGSSYSPSSGSTYSPSFGGGLTGKKCNICNDSRDCHVCYGKGDFYCDSIYCDNGRCDSCNGSGIYLGNGLATDCLTCHYDGRCDICDGTGRYDCTICRGSGRCTNCD